MEATRETLLQTVAQNGGTVISNAGEAYLEVIKHYVHLFILSDGKEIIFKAGVKGEDAFIKPNFTKTFNAGDWASANSILEKALIGAWNPETSY